MNRFDKFNNIRKEFNRQSETLSNVSQVTGVSGFRRLHILWLYPDVLNIHGGRGDVMALLHMCNVLDIPVEIKRCDDLKEIIDWNWPHIVYMTAGELKCVDKVAAALIRQAGEIRKYASRGGFLIANGSSGAALAETTEFLDGNVVRGAGLLNMTWKERESVWGDDIWVRTEDGLDVIGNQIQVADVTLAEGQKPFGKLVYGRGNDGASGCEGAVSGSVIYTGVLGPLLTKNPRLTANFIRAAAVFAGVRVGRDVEAADIEIEEKSAEYIKAFMRGKMGSAGASTEAPEAASEATPKTLEKQ